MNAITYRIMESTDDMLEVEVLQQAVWGMSQRDILSVSTMRWMVHIGGLLIGAWDGDTLVGFSVGSPGKREKKWVFWSDMAGIHPNYQSQGIGYQLKLKQKDWVREQGYTEIRWTFDPMRRGNAYFNFCKLGVISTLYHQSFYGVMKDSINTGLFTDRLEAVWSVSDMEQPNQPNFSDAPFVVKFDGQAVQTYAINSKNVCLEIPYDLDQLKNNNLALAMEWQQVIREMFAELFRLAYVCSGFAKNEARCWYILHKE